MAFNKFKEYFELNNEPIATYFSPGRVNLIGEHIDYNGGMVLPAAIPYGLTAWVQSSNKQEIIIKSVQAEGALKLSLNKETYQKREQLWQNYPLGVIKELKGVLPSTLGLNILIDSNLPVGAGLSSSAALELLIAYILLHYTKHPMANNKIALAKLCQRVENDFVGMKCGIMDQFAVAMGKKNAAILLDCNTLKYQYIPFELGEYKLLILNTNKPRSLVESKYNERKSECDAALAIINRHVSSQISYLCGATMEQLNYITNAVVKKRAKHVVSEQNRVAAAVAALQQGNLLEFGRLMQASHQSLQEDYEVSGFELDTLVDAAMQHSACIGARMTGAGFAGCAIALVKKHDVSPFTTYVQHAYQKATKLPLGVFVGSAVDGVRLLSLFL